MTTFAYNREQSSLAFAHHGAMTKDEFISYAAEYMFGEGSEGLFENISQCQSEINMFGDSGPGTMLRLQEHIAEFNSMADRYTALTGQVVQRPRMPSYPYHPSDDFDDREFF